MNKIKQYKNLGIREDYVCPLCGEKQTVLYQIDKNNKSYTKHTYVWVCELCPHVSLEHWDDEDLKNFNLFMKGKIKEEV